MTREQEIKIEVFDILQRQAECEAEKARQEQVKLRHEQQKQSLLQELGRIRTRVAAVVADESPDLARVSLGGSGDRRED